MSDQDKPQNRKNPDKACQPAVEPLAPEEARSDAQSGLPAHAVGFDPSRPVATSPPPVEMLSGTPDLPLLSDHERDRMKEDAEDAAASTGGGGSDAATPDPKKNESPDPKKDAASKKE